MGISVVTNVASIRSQRNLAKVTQSTSQNIERLSSGLRINRAGDDAARSAISSQMSALQLGLKQADRNANDSISLVQTAEGALNEVGGIVTRMRELAVQSANEGTMDTTERGFHSKNLISCVRNLTGLLTLRSTTARSWLTVLFPAPQLRWISRLV